jgi:hypothetical protein
MDLKLKTTKTTTKINTGPNGRFELKEERLSKLEDR